ncbi:MAG: hypothetical protein PHI57_00265, partial [Bacteroidales bacterium]|nr:hypothetical protein [Bacteroidales bacterium]
VDREARKMDMWLKKIKGKMCCPSYWEEEKVVYNEPLLDEMNDEGIHIDAVISHTAPSFCFPTTKEGVAGWLAKDSALELDLDTERQAMDKLFDYLIRKNNPIADWYYGHFHSSANEYIHSVRFSLLDIQEIKTLWNRAK